MSDKPWRNEEKLREEYKEKGKSSVELSKEWGCCKKTVLNWLDRYGIETRKENKKKPVQYAVTGDGYERWMTQIGSDYKSLYVHQLLAISKYGIDAVKNGVVHHKNTVRWDNRPDNIDVFNSQSEHSKHHAALEELDYEPWRDKEIMEELYLKKEYSTYDIADELGCSRATATYWLHKLEIPTREPNGGS